MQQVTDLPSMAVKTAIDERQAQQMMSNPQRKHALVHTSELPWPRHDTTAVNDGAQASLNIFLHEYFRRQLRRAIEGACQMRRECFSDAGGTDTRNTLCFCNGKAIR